MHCSILGLRVEWETTSYTQSEGIGTVELVLLKEGFASSNVSVEVMTVAGSATGTTSQAHQISFEICNDLLYLKLLLSGPHCTYWITCQTSFSASEDYEAINSSNITFSPEQTSATVSVTIVDDDVLEDMEQFTVEVVATGGQEVDAGDAANILISNDDCKKTCLSTP